MMFISSVKAVRKMIGVAADFLRLRISAAVSKPFIVGMLTSSRMTAKSFFRTSFNASSPEVAVTSLWPSSSNTVL